MTPARHGLRAETGAEAGFASEAARALHEYRQASRNPTRSCTRMLLASESRELRAEGVGAVIWATGYTLDFGWIAIPVFDADGTPQQRRGATAVPGLYFLGLHWMHKAKSSFLYGVGEDAAHIADGVCGDGPQ